MNTGEWLQTGSEADVAFLLPLVALYLDACFADPSFFPHPVCFIGKLYGLCEAPARFLGHERASGLGCVLLAALGSALVASALSGYPVIGGLFALYLSFSGLALGTLVREIEGALRATEDQDISIARQKTSYLVSRDVSKMDRPQLRRALAESISENFNDALVAPFFWLSLGGPPLLWAYKAVSTADSMWGYKTPKWRKFGWGAARLDDVLNWLPARLSAIFLWLGSKVFRCPGTFPGWRTVRSQAARMSSPNSGWPMCVSAWLHDTPMGGPTPYFNKIVQKPRLGPLKSQEEPQAWTPEAIRCLSFHIRVSGLLGCTLWWGLVFAGKKLFFNAA